MTSASSNRTLSGQVGFGVEACPLLGVKMPKYLVKTGLEFPPNRRVEAGDVIDDVPAKSIKWLREQGLIEPFDASAKAAVDKEVVEEPAPVVVEVADVVDSTKLEDDK